MDNEIIYLYLYISIYNILNVILQLSVFTSWELVSLLRLLIYRTVILYSATVQHFTLIITFFRNSLGMCRLLQL